MPRLQQYTSQLAASGTVRPATPSGVDLSGLAGGLASASNSMQRLRDHEERVRADEQQRLAHDEAAVHVINAESRLSMRARERLTELESTSGLTGATQTIGKEFDDWAKEEDAKAPAMAKPVLAKSMARLRSNVQEQTYGAEMKARQQGLVTEFDSGLDDGRRLVYADPSQFNAELARRVALAGNLTISPEARAKLEQRARAQLAYGAASALAERDPDSFLDRAGVRGAKVGKDGKVIPSDPAKAADAVKSDPILSNLTPEHLQSTVDRATMLQVQRKALADAEQERSQRQAEIFAAKREREANQAYTILSDWARDGLMANPAASKPLLDKIAGTPYAAAYAMQADQVKSRTAAAMLPLSAQRTMLDTLVAERNANGTSPALEREIGARTEVLKATRSAYENDPLRAAADRNIVPALAPLDTSSVQSAVGGMAARVSQAQTAEIQAERPVAPVTRAEAESIGNLLKTLPADQRATAIATLSSSMPSKQGQAFAALLDKTDRPTAIAFGLGSLRTTFDRPVAELVLKGAEALKNKTIKEEKTPVDGWGARINAAASAVFSNPQQVEMTSEAARYILAGLVSEGAGASEDDVRRALRLAVGGTIEDRNGSRIVLPAGVERQDLDQRLKNYPAADLGSQLPDGKVYVRGQAIDSAQFLAGLPGAQLRTVGRGRYVVQAGGSVAANARNQPIVIEVPYAR